MKKLLILACITLLSATTFANNAAVKKQLVDQGTDYIACLDLEVMYTIIYTYVEKEFMDNGGGYHYIGTYRWTAEYDAVDPNIDMSWTSHGTGPWIVHANGNNQQAHQTFRSTEVLMANGDYPDLLYKFDWSGTINAAGDFTMLRNNSSYKCLPY